jgi:hypothetical protein
MHYRTIIVIVLAVSAAALPAHADFVIATAPLGFGQPPPHTALRHAEPSSAAIARGFGDRVPLSFAVRQIVPATINVTYGAGVDPDALVDWRGGRSWRVVLADAVKPLGLRVVSAGTAIEIRK